MALPILDGNQTATTLATTVSGGNHYPNHIIASGTVTAILADVVGENGTQILGKAIGLGFNSTDNSEFKSVSETYPLPVTINSGSIPQITGTVTANIYRGQWIKLIFTGYFSGIYYLERTSELSWNTPDSGALVYGGSISVSFNSNEGIWEFFLGQEGLQATANDQSPLPPQSGWGNFDSINSLEISYLNPYTLPISGTVTANAGNFGFYENQSLTTGGEKGVLVGWYDDATGEYRMAGDANPLPISGTVTANVDANSFVEAILANNSYGDQINVQVGNESGVINGSNPLNISGTVTASVTNSVTVGSLPVQLSTTTIGGTARLNVTLSSATTVGATAPSYANLYGGSDGTNLRAISVDSSGRTVVTGATSILGTASVTIGAISGTVTANNPNGSLTTRFGSVTTANTAQITSAVTNTSRRYLLAQNISSGTVTIGIGFTPTTTQGIQLAAGAGMTFDSFCPTGAVWWLGAVTGASWTILEG